MTTILGVRYGDSVYLGSDSLYTYGSLSERPPRIKNAEKILRLRDFVVGFTGSAAMKHALEAFFKNPANDINMESPLGVFLTLQEFHQAIKKDFCLMVADDTADGFESTQSEFIFATPHGLFGVCPERSVLEFETFVAFGSGSHIALGAVDALWEYEMSPTALIKRSIQAASKFDTGTGGEIYVKSVKLLDFSPKLKKNKRKSPKKR